jgi:hypothetical protein
MPSDNPFARKPPAPFAQPAAMAPPVAAPAAPSAPAARPAEFRVFLRALATEMDALAGAERRDEVLRSVGRRLAALRPLPETDTLEALELEMNETLADLGWGSARLSLDEADRALLIHHTGLPRLGAAGEPPGLWLSAVLEGLYEGWMARQPGGDASLAASRIGLPAPDVIALRYGRE